jgi:hypothetical protein
MWHMTQAMRICSFFIIPALLGLVAAVPYYIGYRFFDVHAQLEPAFFGFIEIGVALVAGALCSFFVLRLFRNKQKTFGLILALPAFGFGVLKCLIFQSETLSYVGYGCCREFDTTLLRLVEFAFSPLSPFFIVTGNYASYA